MPSEKFSLQIVEQIAELTEQHEPDLLVAKLHQSLLLFGIDSQLRLYIWRNHQQLFDVYHPLDKASNKMGDDLKLLAEISYDSRIQQHREGDLIGYSICARGQLYNALVFDKGSLTETQQRFLELLLKVYSNQLELIVTSISDHLTGLFNRQKLTSSLHSLLTGENHHQRYDDEEHPDHFFALFDVDFFKKINDNHGHLIGDEVLVLLAQKAQAAFRENDMVFRYGGEEFAVILKHLTREDAYTALERFRCQIADYAFPSVGKVTISLGMTKLAEGMQMQTVLKRADDALYFSKENGRDQLNCYQQLSDQSLIPAVSDYSSEDIELF